MFIRNGVLLGFGKKGTREMNNEPVAWMIIDVDNGKSLQFEENKFSEINIPLYTAPRELSDEEIKIIATQNRTDLTIPAYISFARAIEERHGIK